MPIDRTRTGTPARAVAALLGAALLLELVALTSAARPPHALLAEPLVGAAFAAIFIDHLRARPKLVELGPTLLLGAALTALGFARAPWIDLRTFLGLVGTGFGGASLIACALLVARAKPEDRPAARAALLLSLSLPLFAITLRSGLELAVALRPVSYDADALRLDVALVGAAARGLTRLVDPTSGARDLLSFAHHLAPFAAFALLVSARRRGSPALSAAMIAGLAALAIGFAYPLFGPVRGAGRFGGVERLGTPPLHLVAPLVALLAARGGPAIERILAGALLVVAAASALLLGEARVLDLVLAPALAVAALSLVAREPWSSPERRAAFGISAALLFVWILALRNAGSLLEAQRALTIVLALVTAGAPLLLHRRLDPSRASASAPDGEALFELERPEQASLARAVAPIFFCSGFAGLVYEVVFGKQLALAFGNTAHAASTVLATYMGGMALGSWAGGRLGSRRADPLRVYALSEMGIGLYCALTPIVFSLVQRAYLAFAGGGGLARLSLLQLALGGAAMLPATFLMGVTMPVLTRRFVSAEAGLGRAVGLLYGANTLGAAAGAFVAGYFLLPAFGITRSTFIAVLLNFAAAALGFLLHRTSRRRAPSSGPRDIESPAAPITPESRREGSIALAILLGGGAVTLALEVVYTHLLAVVAGNSAYAFSLMLFAFLIGLGGGAALMRRLSRGREASIDVVGAVEIGLALSILAGVFVWEGIPQYFASFGERPGPLGFAERELIRFVVCLVAMVPPAIFIGALYPVAMDIASRAHPRGPVTGVGRAAALNTLGNISGALLASFVLLPRLGSLRSLHALAAAAAALGALALLARNGRRPLVHVALAATLLLALAQPRRFDLDRLASGANVYFTLVDRGRVIDHAESVSGGLTTVTEGRERDGRPYRTMLTNGKFQGDDSPGRQVKAQYGFALCPLLHTDKRGRALVIGFGVGGTTRALRDAGFAHTDIAELSEDVLLLAHKHFRALNDDVLSHPSVHAHVVDGRNHLLLSEQRYDLISIEISSIWFAGAALLYNRDFYGLARRRLGPGGVLQQWVQFHHVAREDLLSIIATVRAELPRVWVYSVGNQGMIVACEHDCPPSPAAIAAIDAAPGLAGVLGVFGGSVGSLRKEELLSPDGVDRLLAAEAAALGVSLEALVSTDDNMRLEYRTPRGNALGEGASFEANLRMLRRYGR